MLSHLKELKVEKTSYDHVDSAIDMSPGGFMETPSGLTNVEVGNGQQQPQESGERYDHDDEDENSDADAFRNKIETEKLTQDLRFRVNGVVVDHEVKGGARNGWEGVYEIMFKSSTPTGQRVALVLLVMVSMSVVVGELLLQMDG